MATNFYIKVSIGGSGGGGSVVTSVNGRDGAVTLDKTDVGLNNVDNVSLTAQNLAQSEPTGFPNRTDSTISFNAGTRQFSIAPSVTSFDIWIKGTKYTKSVTENLTISTTAGNHYIYFDETGTLQETTTFSVNLFISNAMVSIVYWNSDNNTAPYFADERHGMQMDGATHGYLHTVFGARYLTGLALQGFVPDGTGGFNVNAQFYSDSGTIRDEDILLNIATQSQIPILYREGSLWRKKTADAFPIIYNGTAGYTGTRVPYNQFVTGNWQLTEVTNGDYVLVHFFATNDSNSGVIGILGINKYNNTPAARAAADSEISTLSGLPFAEFTAIGSVIFQTQTSYTNTPKARVVSSDPSISEVYVDFRGEQLYTPSGVATSHSLLSNLSSDDHTQYYNQARGDARYLQLTGGTVTGQTVITGAASVGNSMLRVTNTGVGDCFVVEDSANPDSSPFKIDSSGFIFAGSLLSTTGTSGKFQILDSTTSTFECKAGSTNSLQIGATTSGNKVSSYQGSLTISTDEASDTISIYPASAYATGPSIYTYSDGSDRFTGINKTNPTEALDVSGNVKASGTILGSNLSGTNTGDETNATIKTKLGAASGSQDGYLTSANWTTFNNKADQYFIAPGFGSEIWRGYTFQNNSTTVTVDNMAAQSTNGSPTARTVATTNTLTKTVRLGIAVSTPAANGVCGMRSSTALWTVGSGFRFNTTFSYTDSQYNSGALQFYGMTASTGGITISSTASVSSLLNMIGIGNDAGDTALSIFHNAGGTSTKITLSATDFPCNRTAGAASTDIFKLELYNAIGSSSVLYRVTNLTSGVVAQGTLSSNLPASTTLLTFQAIRTSGASSNACSMDLTKLGVWSLA